MKFKKYKTSASDHHSPCGTPVVIEHEYVYDDDERKPILKATKKHPISDEIQIRAKGCTIAELIERIKKGDAVAEMYMSKSQGLYLNLDEFPSNYHELKRAEFEAQRVYDSLPGELRAKYATVSDFIAGLQAGDFSKPVEEPKKEVKEDEQK